MPPPPPPSDCSPACFAASGFAASDDFDEAYGPQDMSWEEPPLSPPGSRPSSYEEPSFLGRVFASCCAVDPDRKARKAERSDERRRASDELQLERGSDTADIFAIRASLPQGDLFSRSFSSEETISFSARDVDEPRDSLLAPRGSRDSLRSLLRDRPGSRGSLGDSFRGSLGDTVYVPSRRSDSTTEPAPPHPSKPKWKPRSKPPPRTNFDDF